MEKPTITKEDIEIRVIYIRFKGTYSEFRKSSRKLFNDLFQFAKENDLIEEGITKVLTIYHDNPFITDEKNLRTSVALTVPKDALLKEEGQVCSMVISGQYAVLHYELLLGEYEEAWQYAYADWLLKSETEKPRDSIPFELYVNEPPKNFKDKSLTDIYIPVE